VERPSASDSRRHSMSKRELKCRRGWLPLLLAGSFLLAGSASARFTQDPQAGPPPDNSKKNLPTNHQDANRADQQSNSSSDVDLTKKIRRSISRDKSLSNYAHNIKVITRQGVVYLKGPVRSREEKDAIGSKVIDIAGAENVKNELTVKSAS
jgi:hyperosmotically inducible protein